MISHRVTIIYFRTEAIIHNFTNALKRKYNLMQNDVGKMISLIPVKVNTYKQVYPNPH